MNLKSKTELEGSKLELLIEVNAEEFESAVQNAYLKNRNKIAVQGFRKGKAPRKMIEKLYGEGCFYEDAVNMMVPFWVRKIVDDEKLELVDRPALDIVSLDKENGVVLKAVCQLRPVAEVSDYKGIEMEKAVNTVSDEDVQKEINKLLDRNAKLVSVDDRAAQMDDTIIFDFDGYIDGEQFEGGQAEKFSLVLGSNHFIPGFEEQIVGHTIGEDFSISVTFPEDYHMDQLKGKAAEFKIKIHEISYKELPVFDDEFIKDATEFETVDDYKEDLTKKLTVAAEKKAESEFENKLFEKMLENVKVEVPQVMVESKIDDLVRDFDMRLQRQGVDLNTYLAYSGMDLENFRKTFEDSALVQTKLRLAFERIADIEGLEATEKEAEDEMMKMADAYKLTFDQVKQYVHPDDVREDLKVGKAAKLVKDSAIIK